MSGHGWSAALRSARHKDAPAGPGYKWVALSNTTLGVLIATMDASIVIISLPAIFRGIGLDPLAPGNIGYLLWMILGYLLVSAVLVVVLGRLGDMFGRVKIYNLGFLIFACASVALSLDPFRAGAGALWLILWRIVQAFGGSMLTANSAAILTDAFPARQRGMALGINQITALAGQFLGLLAGGITMGGRRAKTWLEERSKPKYLTATVSRGRVETVVNSTGTVKPVLSVSVGAFTSGPIAKVNVDFNSVVKKDQVLALIDPQLLEAAVERDRAAVDSQKADLNRVEALLQQAKNNEKRALDFGF